MCYCIDVRYHQATPHGNLAFKQGASYLLTIKSFIMKHGTYKVVEAGTSSRTSEAYKAFCTIKDSATGLEHSAIMNPMYKSGTKVFFEFVPNVQTFSVDTLLHSNAVVIESQNDEQPAKMKLAAGDTLLANVTVKFPNDKADVLQVYDIITAARMDAMAAPVAIADIA